ncbi:Membrane trafficking and cell signaling protein HRS, contains VHS and FYVE domains [Plasmopara halstedii]|uniref:Membrane trafficking and cell signaling protein HRS, contains VHS and FYVE domains n=1 Tax=Plasmopara halstedii TaxID=4781 RepID=A0A0P1AV30_PLAHL|nr:Membrane trafficking and cell signaling protein HRS, contains VHS and FYVE domains [Plasmopara halstedii]CEG45349.1 Membrane trafficking and cell signaling protein HRS, contains VHS and FYVE domains [Plasmopara halstedii]|eukprot:XP_024581718.1 Membrane trafficking and cell signaling protein HRS, contains VHS and FYVE domains [Plasmopara halstedii]
MDSNVKGSTEAIRLAQASDWKGLHWLLERDPLMAQKPDDHDMLPLHWVCTVRRVPLSLIAKLLQAYPDGVRAKNSGKLLPLHIAIRARVQASCLRKLLRAYPGAIHEQTPDGITALEMAVDIGLDSESMKVLYRAYKHGSILHQHPDNISNEGESADSDLQQRLSAQEEGEASGITRLDDEECNQKINDWSDNIIESEPYVGTGGYTNFFHVTDDGEIHPALDPENSISMMSEQSLCAMDGLDSPHGYLVSPSSTSSCSQGETRTPRSSCSSFEDGFYVGSRTGLTGFLRQNQDSTRQQSRLYRTNSLLTPAPNRSRIHERDTRAMIPAMSSNTGVTMTQEEVARRHHSRHQSLPLMSGHVNLRRNSSLPLYNRVDDENETLHDCNSPAGVAPVNPQSQHIQSGHESTQSRHAITRDGHQRISPPLSRKTHRRASDDSHGRGRFEPPPEWKHDGECSICRASFGMFKHRHHCRNCGKSICSQHSADKKISMETKGFTTPQRVCVTCYAMIIHSRSLKQDLELDDIGRGDSIVNRNDSQQPYHASATTDRIAFASSSTSGVSRHGTVFGSARSPISAEGSPIFSPSLSRRAIIGKANVIAAGEATGGAGECATHGSGLTSPVHELRCLLASQQKQIEQLAQSNMQMQQQLLEQEELKAETMLLITQLMTRVSVLELQKDRSFVSCKRRSAGTGESEDEDEEFPQDESLQVGTRFR